VEIKNNYINTNIAASQYNTSKDKTSSQSFASTLKTALETEDQKKLYASCQELESVFLSQVLNSMRSTLPEGGLLEKSFATETFESMLYDEYSKEASKTGSLGLGDIIYKQLSATLKSRAEKLAAEPATVENKAVNPIE